MPIKFLNPCRQYLKNMLALKGLLLSSNILMNIGWEDLRSDCLIIVLKDQDNPSSYSNHTCEVKGSYHKRQHDDSEGSQPHKRLRASDSEDSIFEEAAAHQERQRSHHTAGINRARHLEEPRINPIDHIFQFHKVSFHSPFFALKLAFRENGVPSVLARYWQNIMIIMIIVGK